MGGGGLPKNEPNDIGGQELPKNIGLSWGQIGPSVITPQKILWGIGRVRWVGAPLISLPISNFIGGWESVKIWGVQSILVIWQLVFACFRVTLEVQPKQQEEKGCLMVMIDFSDLGHGKKY